MKKEKIGALWKRKSKDGTKTFLTGKIGEQEVIIFTNTRKSQPNHPDFEVYPSEPRQPKPAAPPPADDAFDF